jgi:hypothetical protein
MMRNGRLLAIGTPEDLQIGSNLPSQISFRLPAGTSEHDLPELSERPRPQDGHLLLATHEPVRDSWRLTGWAADRGVPLAYFAVNPPTLEDVTSPSPRTTVMAVEQHVAIQARPDVRAIRPYVLMSLTAHAVRAFARNPIAAFFTLGFPLSFLVIVASILGDQSTGPVSR